MNEAEKLQKLNQIGRDVLKLSRNPLLVNLRFLDAALSQFILVPYENGSFTTDGKYLFYDPLFVLRRYNQEKEIPVRDYLHVLMHCIFQHRYGASDLDRKVWDLACDIAVEKSISDLGLKSSFSMRDRRIS